MRFPAFLREPAWWVHAAAVAGVLLFTVFPHFTLQQQGWINAVFAAAAGVVVAALTHDGIFAAVMGLIKAALMVMLAYHWVPFLTNITPDQLAAIFTVLAGLSAAYTRTQAVAPIGPQSATVGTVAPPPAVTVPQ